MQWTSYAFVPLVGAAMIGLIGARVWLHRPQRGAWHFLVFLGAELVWLLAYTASILTHDAERAIFAMQLSFFGIALVCPALLMLVACWTRQASWASRRAAWFLYVPPLVLAVLAVTNDQHHLFWRSYTFHPDAAIPAIVTRRGPGFWIHTAYAYACLALAVGLLARHYWHHGAARRAEAAAVFFAIALPSLTSVVRVVAGAGLLGPMDLTPLAFAVSSPVLAYALFDRGLFGLLPISHAALIDALDDGLLVVNDVGVLVAANGRARQWLRLPLDGDALGFATEALASQPELVALLEEDRERAELRLGIDGAEAVLEVRQVALRRRHGARVGRMLVLHDVSERVRSAERLREKRALLETVVDNIPYQVFWKDAGGRFLGANQAFARVAGVATASGLVGRLATELGWSEETAAAYGCGDEAVLRCGKPRLHEERKLVATDGRTATLLVSTVPLHGGRGGIDGLLGIVADVTEQRRFESQLAQAQKLESIGQLASGIAHEINTPIQYVSDNVAFLRESVAALLGIVERFRELLEPDAPATAWAERHARMEDALASADFEFLGAEVPQALAQCGDGLSRVTHIVAAMKKFSHPGSDTKDYADLNEAIRATSTVCANRWKYVADLELDLDPALPEVPCLVAEINQVLLNLIVNASDALAEGGAGEEKGSIRISTRCDGRCVEVRVSDDGPGIPESLRGRIFDPFFTTKEPGKGTGQGLAISRNVVVDRHGGTLDVESATGLGTTFRLRLPLQPAGDGAPSA